jgi:4,5-DOPA dioxygenase extradiol
MERKQFIQSILAGVIGMTSLSSFNRFTSELKEQEELMPVLFIGHGSPMNGIEDSEFSRRWTQMAKEISTPKAVLVVSAHWFTKGTKITAALAKETAQLLHSAQVELDHDWGLDHGTWTIVRHMYPEANIPVMQLSIDFTKGPQYHYELAKELYALRKKGVLIMGSGNLVHNLRMVAWDRLNDSSYGYDWAVNINNKFKELITAGDHKPLIEYSSLGKEALLAIPTPEHYLPLMYTLGLKNTKDKVSFFNDKAVGGSLTMTSIKIG